MNYIRELMIFHRKVSFLVSYKKVTFITKLKLKSIKFIIFPIDNMVKFMFYIRTKKNWFLLKRYYNKD